MSFGWKYHKAASISWLDHKHILGFTACLWKGNSMSMSKKKLVYLLVKPVNAHNSTVIELVCKQ